MTRKSWIIFWPREMSVRTLVSFAEVILHIPSYYRAKSSAARTRLWVLSTSSRMCARCTAYRRLRYLVWLGFHSADFQEYKNPNTLWQLNFTFSVAFDKMSATTKALSRSRSCIASLTISLADHLHSTSVHGEAGDLIVGLVWHWYRSFHSLPRADGIMAEKEL